MSRWESGISLITENCLTANRLAISKSHKTKSHCVIVLGFAISQMLEMYKQLSCLDYVTESKRHCPGSSGHVIKARTVPVSLHEKSVAALKCVATCCAEFAASRPSLPSCQSQCQVPTFQLLTPDCSDKRGGELDMIQILAASVGVVCKRTFVLNIRNLVILHSSSEKENGSHYGIISCYSLTCRNMCYL